MATTISTEETGRLNLMFSAERANFANFAIALNILNMGKQYAEQQYNAFKSGQASIFKYHADYNNYVASHNVKLAKWLELKNRYTERQRKYRDYPDAVLREGNDSIIQATINLFSKTSDGSLGIAFIIPIICIALGSLLIPTIKGLFTHENNVLNDYKELAALTNDLAKTNPDLANKVMENYNGAKLADINANLNISTQVGQAVKTVIIVGGIGATIWGGFKLYQLSQSKNK